ncbi:MAG: GNAT family N-acetyltransferase [Bdellovibrionales bacterium]|nr:GNAT family N-acetyltransferase [Bdellovibrionales bacterium]
MDGPRAPHAVEFPEVLNFFNRQLRPESQWTVDEEYPLVLSPQKLSNVRIIKQNGQYLSGAVIKCFPVKTVAGLFKVAGLGNVVTDPAHREQGLSRSVINDLLETAQFAACDFAILWSDLHDFYRKLGFELAGTEVCLRLENEWESPSNLKFIESSHVSPEAINRIYNQHTCGAIRTAEDIRKSLKIPNAKVYTAWDQNSNLQAYAIEGKGADLNACIHEWGGAVSRLIPLLAFIRKSQQRPLTLLAPKSAQNLKRQLEEQAHCNVHEGVLGMIKILNYNIFYSKIRRYARSLGFDNFVLEHQNNISYFGIEGQALFKTDQPSDMVRLIFGPQNAQELHSFDSKSSECLQSIFPIPFWLWGWDSV